MVLSALAVFAALAVVFCVLYFKSQKGKPVVGGGSTPNATENTQQTVSEKIEEDTDTLETKNEQKHDESDI